MNNCCCCGSSKSEDIAAKESGREVDGIIQKYIGSFFGYTSLK